MALRLQRKHWRQLANKQQPDEFFVLPLLVVRKPIYKSRQSTVDYTKDTVSVTATEQVVICPHCLRIYTSPLEFSQGG